jgi:hypothetical protein
MVTCVTFVKSGKGQDYFNVQRIEPVTPSYPEQALRHYALLCALGTSAHT